jgi:putative membrane protein
MPPGYGYPPYMPVYVDPQTGYVLPYAQHGWNEHRLHWATVVVQVVRFLKSIAFVIGIAIVMRLTGRGDDWIEVLVTLLGAFSVAGAVLKYMSFRYAIVDNALHVRSGILFRQDRSIPIERIQNINTRQQLIHRMLGVVDVYIETASGGAGQAEASLSVVSLAEAERLRAALTRRVELTTQALPTTAVSPTLAGGETATEAAAGTMHATRAAEGGEVVYRASLRDLMLAGATTNRLGSLLAAALGVLVYIQTFVRDDRPIMRAIERGSARMSMPGWSTITLAIAALVVLGWLTSIVLTVVTKFGFQLVRVRGQLERSYGLTTRHHSVFPVQRVQMLKVRSPIIQRQIGLCHVSAETAGSFRDAQGGQEAGSSELCPILRTRRADDMCRLALPTFSFDALQWQPTSTLARWRAFVRLLIGLSLPVAAGAILYTPWTLAALPVVFLTAFFGSAWYFRAIGFAVQGEFVAMRGGVFTRTVRVVPKSKVQASFVVQSPLQLRLGLATFRVLTAGSAFGATAQVPDLPLQTALDLQEHLHRPTTLLPAEKQAESDAAPSQMDVEPTSATDPTLPL